MSFNKDKNLIIYALSICMFLLAYYLLTHNVSNEYWMKGDQTRDWRLAAQSHLQLVGTPMVTFSYLPRSGAIF
ncbi:MAG: hypothetical protein V4591_09370 [Bdellovibrionota bacterium]